MGLYLGRGRAGEPTDDPSPVVTPREYVSLLSNAIESVLQTPAKGCDSYERGVAHLASGRPNAAVHAFASFVRLYPDDPVGHRMLGLAHLAAGHFLTRVKHRSRACEILTGGVQLP